MPRIYCFVAVVALVSALGCGESPAPVSGGGPLPTDPVALAVHQFLEAIRTGDTAASSSRLTPLAVQRINENDMVFAPPASQSARFQVGPVQMYSADKAFVDTIWTDTDADGVPVDEHMTWALKLESGQWRISGMAAQMGAGQQPVLMDFENPGQIMGPSRQNAIAQPAQPNGATEPRQASQPTQDPFR